MFEANFDGSDKRWRAWADLQFNGREVVITPPRPWRAYRKVLTAIDRSRLYRSNNTRLGKLIGFSDRIDYNQASGIGWLLMLLHLDPCPVKDLTGRTVSFEIRGDDWVPNGSKTVFWIQGHCPGKKATANFACKRGELNELLQSGKWEPFSIKLNPVEDDYTYAGNNIHQENPERYQYAPVCDILHTMDNLHLISIMPSQCDNFPSGKIHVRKFRID